MLPIYLIILLFLLGAASGTAAVFLAETLRLHEISRRKRLPRNAPAPEKKETVNVLETVRRERFSRLISVSLVMGVFTVWFYGFHVARMETLAAEKMPAAERTFALAFPPIFSPMEIPEPKTVSLNEVSQICGEILTLQGLRPGEIRLTYGEILTLHGRFLFQMILITLLLAASLIDLDEKIIPDLITVPGTLLALLAAVIFPVTLPGKEPAQPTYTYSSLQNSAEFPGGMSGRENRDIVIQPISFMLYFPEVYEKSFGDRPLLYTLTPTAPHSVLGVMRGDWKSWGSWGLITGLLCWWGWCFGLMNRVWRMNHGFQKAWRIFCARLSRDPSTRMLVSLGNIGTLVIMITWFYAPLHWVQLWTALVGMGIAGGMMWCVRFVSSLAMGREAMGFGDVVLMAMLGAFLGWQPCVALFFIAPFIGIVLGVVLMICTGDSEIPYGPFLCAAAVITMIFWQGIWEMETTQFLVSLDSYTIFGFTAGCLVMMVVLLAILRGLRKLVGR